MKPTSIRRTARLFLAIFSTALAADARAEDLQRRDVVVQSIRGEWPVVREASGRWVVVGEATAQNEGPCSARVQSVRLRVFDGSGHVLATQDFNGPRALRRMLGVITMDAEGHASRKPEGTTTLEPGDLGVALLGTLAGSGPLMPQQAEVTIGFATGQPVLVTVPLVGFDTAQKMSWPLGFERETPWVALNNFSPGDPFPEHRQALFLTPPEPFISQRFAIDTVQVDASGETSNPPKSAQKDSYYGWGEEILSTGAGEVVAVVTDQPDQEVGNEDPSHPAGNYVVVKHGPRLFSVYAHMMLGSAAVAVGDLVASGQVLGRVGNSGNTTEPHLHFHFVDRWDGPDPVISFYTSQGVPALFWNAHVRRGPRTFPLQGTTPLARDLVLP